MEAGHVKNFGVVLVIILRMGFRRTPGRSGSGPFTGSPRVDPKAKNFYRKLTWRDLQQKQTCEHSLFDFQLNSPEGFSFHEQIVRTSDETRPEFMKLRVDGSVIWLTPKIVRKKWNSFEE